MLGRHHGDSSAKQKEPESELHLSGCQSWGLHAAPLPTCPVMMECSICSGPYMGYTLEDSWQPRQRTQAGSAFLCLIIKAKSSQLNEPAHLRQFDLFIQVVVLFLLVLQSQVGKEREKKPCLACLRPPDR